MVRSRPRDAIGTACILLLALTLAPSPSAASDEQEVDGLAHTTPGQRASFQTELMTTLLHLSDAQVEKVGALNLEYAKQLDPILKGSGSRFERLMKGRKILEGKDAAMQQVLSAEQYKQYLDTKSEVRRQLETKFAKSADGGTTKSDATPTETGQ